jgi:hypothetical protein
MRLTGGARRSAAVREGEGGDVGRWGFFPYVFVCLGWFERLREREIF